MKELLTRTRGQVLVEYALILVLIAIGVIGVLTVLGSSISNVFSQVVKALEQEPPSRSEGDCYGSLLLPYLVGLTRLVVFRLLPPRPLASSPALILSSLAVASCEEVFFRGYLLGRLKALGGNRWGRILLVCALFMFYKVLVHSWEGWSLAAYVGFFVFGAFKMLFETGWVDWSGSIVTPIVIHIGWDLIMFQGYSGPPPWAL